MFTQAGLTREKDLGLSSVRAWAGRHAFDLTGRIEDAAAVMGCRTLDGAARLIGWDWTERPQ
jgi:integrase/recombinase XerC